MSQTLWPSMDHYKQVRWAKTQACTPHHLQRPQRQTRKHKNPCWLRPAIEQQRRMIHRAPLTHSNLRQVSRRMMESHRRRRPIRRTDLSFYGRPTVAQPQTPTRTTPYPNRHRRRCVDSVVRFPGPLCFIAALTSLFCMDPSQTKSKRGIAARTSIRLLNLRSSWGKKTLPARYWTISGS